MTLLRSPVLDRTMKCLTSRSGNLYPSGQHNIILILLVNIISDRIRESESLFTYAPVESSGRKRRQTSNDFECTSFDNCGDHSFVGVSFEDLDINQTHREFCKNDEFCIYDLIVTEDYEFTNTTLMSSEEDQMIQAAISEYCMYQY